MNKIYGIILISLLVLISCQSTLQEKPGHPHHKHYTSNNPLWLYELPVGSDYIVGISTHSQDSLAMVEAAKEMAAVMMARNTGSYTIQKSTQTDSEDHAKNGKATFNLNVGAPEEAKNNFSSLHLIDSHKLDQYFIGLFAESSKDIDPNYKKRSIRSFPKWYREKELDDTGGFVTTWVEAGSYDLGLAWEKAAEKARYQIADYLEKDVQANVINTNDDITKKIAIETTKLLTNLEITRSYIITEKIDTLYSYKVYLEMKMRKRFN